LHDNVHNSNYFLTLSSADNTSWARNGDFVPNRWEAQQEAMEIIIRSKLNNNPENCCGLMSLGGKQ